MIGEALLLGSLPQQPPNMLNEHGDLETALTVEIVTGKRRYEALLRGGLSPLAKHDRPLLARAEWLVAPTLGSIVPNWLLLIPRDPTLNFREWADLNRRRPLQLLRDVRLHLGLRADEIVWFEHGPCRTGTSIGCGLDHAHIHILIRPCFSFLSFMEKARSLSDLDWTAGEYDDPYYLLAGGSSYLIAGCGESTIIAQGVEATGSQFFRRVVGALVDVGDAWDYRQYPHTHNVYETIRTFRSLESAARRG
jgi:ATP adenylyltransferase